MNRKLLVIALVLVMVVALGLAACQQTVTLTLYDTDGETVFNTVKVKKGTAPEKPADPTKPGYTFDGWFITPTNNTPYDFTKALDEDAAAYAHWTDNNFVDDRDWVMVGTMNNWGKGSLANAHLTKKTGTNNVYEMTVDLYEDDAFQLTVRTAEGDLTYESEGARAAAKHLVGAEEYMVGSGGLGSYQDIKVLQDGKYKLTLTSAAATDSNKLEVERIGDAAVKEDVEVINYYIKGQGITYWADAYVPSTMFTENAQNELALTVYLKENEQFMFTKIKTVGETSSQADTFNFGNVDTASAALFNEGGHAEGAHGNLIAKVAGYYTFVLDTETKTLSATLDTEKQREEMNYFVDGNILGGAWNDYQKAEKQEQYKMIKNGSSDIYSLEGVQLTAGEELVIRTHKASDTELTWQNEVQPKHDSSYLFGTVGFEAASKINLNIKVVESGTYNIIYDAYTQFVTIAKEGKDVYIKGSMDAGWNHNFKPERKFSATQDKNVYELTIALDVNTEFGLETYYVGSKVGGVYVSAKDNLGTAGDAHSSFDATGYNLKCTVAGTYKLSYNIETGKLDIYNVTEPSA